MRPLAWVAVAFALGIAVADWVRPHPALALAAMAVTLAGAALVAAVARSSLGPALPWLCLSALAAGAWRYAVLRHGGPETLGPWRGQVVALQGTLREARLDPDRWQATVAVEAVRPVAAGDWQPAQGLVRVEVALDGPLPSDLPAPGRRVVASGRLVEPPGPSRPGSLDVRSLLGRQGIFWLLQARVLPVDLGPGREAPWERWASSLRQRCLAVLAAALPPDRAALLAGLVLGTREGIPDDWQSAFRVTGVYHVLAASGANVALVALPWHGLLRRAGVGRRGAALGVIPAIWLYCLVAGAGPPVTRAGIMASLAYLGQALDRPADPHHNLAAAALILLAVRPGELFDLGFQLSFAATWGILVLAPRLCARLERWLLPLVARPLAVSLAAAAAVDPLLVRRFGAVSLLSPVANLWASLLLEVLVPLAALGLALGLAVPWAAGPFLGLAGLLLPALVLPMDWLSRLPVALWPVGKLALGWMVGWYLALGLALWGRDLAAALGDMARALGRVGAVLAARARPVLAAAPGRLGAAAAVAVVAVPAVAGVLRLGQPDPVPALQVVVLPGGYGEVVALGLPAGSTLLVDGGLLHLPPGAQDPAPEALGRLWASGFSRLDRVVVVRPSRGPAVAYAALAAGWPVGEIWGGGGGGGTRWERLVAAAAQRGVPVRDLGQGWTLALAGGATVDAWRQPGVGGLPALRIQGAGWAVWVCPGGEAKAGECGAWPGPGVQVVVAPPAVAISEQGRPLRRLDTSRHGTVEIRAGPGGVRIATDRLPWPEASGRLLGAW